MKITVIWMNGQKETHRCKNWEIENSNYIWLYPEEPILQEPITMVPLQNVMKVTFDA